MRLMVFMLHVQGTGSAMKRSTYSVHDGPGAWGFLSNLDLHVPAFGLAVAISVWLGLGRGR